MLSLGVQELSVGGPRGWGADEATVQAGPLARAWLAVGRVEGSTGSLPRRGGVSLEQEGRLERVGGLAEGGVLLVPRGGLLEREGRGG